MDIVSRLKSFLKQNGIANSQFADTCLIPRPTLSQLLNGRNKKVSDEIITKIHVAYPELNIMWLMFGDGEMFVSAGPKQNIEFPGDAVMHDENAINSGAFNGNAQNAAHATQRTISFGGGDYSAPSKPGVGQPQTGRLPAAAHTQHHGSTLSQAIESVARSFGGNSVPNATGVAPQRRIANIMVFFDDNSYEIFTPNR